MEMTKTRDEKAERVMDLWSSSRLAIFAQVSFMTVLIMALLGGGGYFLDQWLGTYPALFITGLVLAFPVVQFSIYKKFKDFAKNKLK